VLTTSWRQSSSACWTIAWQTVSGASASFRHPERSMEGIDGHPCCVTRPTTDSPVRVTIRRLGFYSGYRLKMRHVFSRADRLYWGSPAALVPRERVRASTAPPARWPYWRPDPSRWSTPWRRDRSRIARRAEGVEYVFHTALLGPPRPRAMYSDGGARLPRQPKSRGPAGGAYPGAALACRCTAARVNPILIDETHTWNYRPEWCRTATPTPAAGKCRMPWPAAGCGGSSTRSLFSARAISTAGGAVILHMARRGIPQSHRGGLNDPYYQCRSRPPQPWNVGAPASVSLGGRTRPPDFLDRGRGNQRACRRIPPSGMVSMAGWAGFLVRLTPARGGEPLRWRAAILLRDGSRRELD
jgi:hypothetical protein